MTAKIVTYENYVAGWLDSSVHDFLESLSTSDASTKFALITCLDSNPNPACLLATSPELKAIASKLDVRGTGLLVPADLMFQAISKNQIFFGFDEVWFSPNKSIKPNPRTVSLVGPSRLTPSKLKKLGKWMTDNSCSLGLGGGKGLNFVVQAHGLVRHLLGTSIEQPESSLVCT